MCVHVINFLDFDCIYVIHSFFSNTGSKVILSVPEEWQPNIDDIQFVLMTINRQHIYSVTNAASIIQNFDFNPNWDTVIFSLGWNSMFNDANLQVRGLRDAYMCRGNVNFIVRDNNRC